MTKSRSFAPSDGSVGGARRFVVDAIADAPTEVKETVALMVSELATNALVHAATGFDVSVDRSDRTVLVSVRDRGDGGVPTLQAPPSSEPHGRGLRVVDAMSEEWGVDATWDQGKTVWFRVSLDAEAIRPAIDGSPAKRPVGRDDQRPTPRRTGAGGSGGGAGEFRRSGTPPRPQAKQARHRQDSRSR